MNFLYKIFNTLGHKLHPGAISPIRRSGKQLYSPLQLDNKELGSVVVVKFINFLVTAWMLFMVAGLIPNLMRLTFSMLFSWTVFMYWGMVGIGIALVPLLHFLCWITYG